MLYLKSLNRLNLMLALTLTTGLVACSGAENTPDEPPFSPELTGLQTNFEFMHDGLARKFHFYAPEASLFLTESSKPKCGHSLRFMPGCRARFLNNQS